jgi:hypothetical protein
MLFSRNALFAAAAALVAASSGSAFAPTSTCEFFPEEAMQYVNDVGERHRDASCFVNQIWSDCGIGDFSRISTR